MNLYKYLIPALAALALCSCAVEKETLENDDDKMYLDKWIIRVLQPWMEANNPGFELKESGSGIYIIKEDILEGEGITEDGYLFVTYTVRDLEGTVSSTSDAEVAKRLYTYNKSYYYGPNVWTAADNGLNKGVADVITGMTPGSTRTALIPGWLQTFNRYDSKEDYYNNVTDNSPQIYTIKLWGKTADITQWQTDSLANFSKYYLGGIEPISTGFYYKTLKEAAEEDKDVEMHKDTTIYINYTGRLLNGQVFDTTIKDTAKVHNIYSSSKTYEPVSIEMNSDSTQVTMESSSIIAGFAKTIWEMKPMEKGVGVFYSDLGYGSSGSGSAIPAYAPLVFEVELVAKPEDE